ncbi:hypothetical protein [Leptolyngbya sp. FACHB-671]|nr:hypothetical protein [Leptolyngbya sp. FACHB-671]
MLRLIELLLGDRHSQMNQATDPHQATSAKTGEGGLIPSCS